MIWGQPSISLVAFSIYEESKQQYHVISEVFFVTEVLIRGVPDEDLARIDERATRLGLSRGEYLRRRIMQDAALSSATISLADLERFASLSRDLLNDEVMRDAWS